MKQDDREERFKLVVAEADRPDAKADGKLPLRYCAGCEDDFYNDKNPMGVKECWSRKTAQLVTRYRTGTWTLPTTKGAFTEVEVPSCYRQKGSHFFKQLPDFVKAEDVVRRRRT